MTATAVHTFGRHWVLGMPVDLLTLDEGVDRLGAAINAVRAGAMPIQVVTMNAEMAMQAQADPALGAIIRGAGLVTADGSGVVWALRRRGITARKVAGVELVRAVAERAAREGWSIYFLGAKPGVAQEAADKLGTAYPGLRIAGIRDGYFKPEGEAALRDEIRAARPDVILVALGVPRQEKWIAEHQADLGVPVAMGVGGSLDVFAGRVNRAPLAFQKLHLEWLYRLIQEPWRFQRMGSTLPAFVKEVLKRDDHAKAPEVQP